MANLEAARAALYNPTDPRITQEILFEAISEAYYKVMVGGLRPKADFTVKADRAGLDVMTKKFWRPGINNFQAAMRAAIHIPDPENRICVLVGDPDSIQGIPLNPLQEIHRRDLRALQTEDPTPDTDRRIGEMRWTINLLKHNSRESLLTPEDDEWRELQELAGYHIYQLRPDDEKGHTYEMDRAISIAQMQSPVFAFRDRDWLEKVKEKPES